MRYKKNGGVAPGSGKTQCRTGKWEGVDGGEGGGKRAYGTFGERDQGKGKSFEM